ncbi:MAG TPA: protein kinase [Pirellulales bacterium]|jgi:serine/threonine protein kinase/Leucine-rich repeat (LRR) protein|nr:protein kinase [Pirellulales bacterium]
MPATHTADCPPKRLIVDFSRGKLNDAAAETVSAHLETCIDCRAAVEHVAADSFIQRLRAAHGHISAAAPLSSQADSVSRANSNTATFESPQPSPSTPAEPSVPPELLDHPDYELVKELGRGGMGVVYLARNRAMDRLEVLKAVSRSLLEKADARERFQREIRSAAKLSHPNIVTAHSVPRAGDLLIFAMEYVDGQDLSQVVKQRGPLPVVNAVYYAHQAALGLQHAHEHGMVHRDIKPNNLILSVQAKRHLVKILDFGLAKATSEKVANSELTGSGQILGTPDYMAPEQSLDSQNADIRADIYSLGCTLYYMLAGRPPFEGASVFALLAAHHSSTARLLSDIRTDVPVELAAVVAKMMAKDPAHRYQTPAQVSQALEPFYRTAGGEAAKLAPMAEEAVSRNTPPEVFDPYYQWLGIAPEEQPVDCYRLLGAKRFEPTPEVIANLADQRMAHLRTFQDGQHSALSRKLLDEVAAARVCLLNADQRAAYDAELRRSIAARPQALPPIAVPLALPLEAVDAPAAASPATAHLSATGGRRLAPRILLVGLASLAGLILSGVLMSKFLTRGRESGVNGDRPNAEGGNKPWESAAFRRWANEVAAVPAEQEVRAVVKKLQELNPGFDGKETHTIDRGAVTILYFSTDDVTDISPVRALTGLDSLDCAGSRPGSGALSDLSPLQGMRLRRLDADYTRVSDISPLERMPLTWLSCWAAPVSDFSPLRGMPLTFLSCGYARASDLSPLKGMPLGVLYCDSTNVSDLSPLRGMPLTKLRFAGTQVSDLSPLKGMPLELLGCDHTGVSDVSPLRGMHLSDLTLTGTRVSDLSPLNGMPLKRLWFGETPVANLSPLTGMPLRSLACDDTPVSDLSPLDGMHLTELFVTPKNITTGLNVIRQMNSLASIGIDGDSKWPPVGFWKKYDAGDFLSWDKRPGFEKWMAETTALTAEKQLHRVAEKLHDLNPGFDGKLTGLLGRGAPKVDYGIVTELGFSSDHVADISPVRALHRLEHLWCAGNGSERERGRLADISPLNGMQLKTLNFNFTSVSDISPLKGMPLSELLCQGTRVLDLSPLEGMRLTRLDCGICGVSDLSPLRGMRLTYMNCGTTPVADLSPINGMQITELHCDNTRVADLRPLTGMPLTVLTCEGTPVADFSPLAGMSLRLIHFTPKNITKGFDLIRRMNNVTNIGVGWQAKAQFSPDDFWRKYDAGEFK